MMIHTKDKPFQCKQCEKAFSWKGDRDSHMYTHTGEKPYQCIHFEKEFSQMSNLSTHMLTHSGENISMHRVLVKIFIEGYS